MGESLLWAVIGKLQKYHTFFGFFIPTFGLIINFDKTCVGLHFGSFFHKLLWSPWSHVSQAKQYTAACQIHDGKTTRVTRQVENFAAWDNKFSFV
jgi:hypothetical protein